MLEHWHLCKISFISLPSIYYLQIFAVLSRLSNRNHHVKNVAALKIKRRKRKLSHRAEEEGQKRLNWLSPVGQIVPLLMALLSEARSHREMKMFWDYMKPQRLLWCFSVTNDSTNIYSSPLFPLLTFFTLVQSCFGLCCFSLCLCLMQRCKMHWTQLLYACGKWQHIVSAAVNGLSDLIASFATRSLLFGLDLLFGPSCGSTCDWVLSSLLVKLSAVFCLWSFIKGIQTVLFPPFDQGSAQSALRLRRIRFGKEGMTRWSRV